MGDEALGQRDARRKPTNAKVLPRENTPPVHRNPHRITGNMFCHCVSLNQKIGPGYLAAKVLISKFHVLIHYFEWPLRRIMIFYSRLYSVVIILNIRVNSSYFSARSDR